MKRHVAAAIATFAAAAWAQPGLVDIGKREFENSCASCHGTAAKGDGPLAKHLVKAPTDLTTLARRNGGVFPARRVLETIDGRTSTDIGPHGNREMPIWGTIYRAQGADPAAADWSPGWYARSRMLALMEYLARVQAQ